MGFPLPDTGSVTEDVDVGGLLIATGDADFGPLFNNDAGAWTAETLTGAYDSQLTINEDGEWTYQADNDNAAIQALDAGETLTEVFTISSTAGTTTVTITINGADEPPCFVSGTYLDTPSGPRAVETLKPGDRVLTRDDGPQTVRWVGRVTLDIADAGAAAHLAPIRVARDAIAPGVPDRDVLFSPMHRVLLNAPDAALLFGGDEVLCAIKHLVNGTTIRAETTGAVTYVHVLFDRHQLVKSHGFVSESFLPGPVGLAALEAPTRDEVFELFPELRGLPSGYGPAARQVLRGYEAKLLSEAMRNRAPNICPNLHASPTAFEFRA